MFLNTNVHFMAAKGHASYASAARKVEKVRGLIEAGKKPLMMVIARHTYPDKVDYVPVCILPLNSEFPPMFFAYRGIYVTNTTA
mgnify:CR=1 FL=1